MDAICQIVEKNSPDAVRNRVSDPNKTRVAVLMSGGVDSSTCAALLLEQGYEVVGVTGWLIKSGSRCCDTGMIDAARVCEDLDIEHHAVDLRELFKSQIIDQFHQSYERARTPLPCSLCNTLIKWGALLNYAKKHLNAKYIATGHYARVVEVDGVKHLARAKDNTKDQSYVLWGITRDQLESTLLPLGDLLKSEIRGMAQDRNLVVANRPDSQDLCFIPQGSTVQDYLALKLDERPGAIIHVVTGEILGEHKGTHNFTIGQRRGIKIAYAEPLYVISLDPDTRVVYVGPKEALLKKELTASFVNWLVPNIPTEPFEAMAKVRYNSKTKKAMVYPLPKEDESDFGKVKVIFDEPEPAITPGQVLGIYDTSDTYILGGGWID